MTSTTIEDMVRADLHESLTAIVNRTHEIGDAIVQDVFRFKPEDIAQTWRSRNGQTQSQIRAVAKSGT